MKQIFSVYSGAGAYAHIVSGLAIKADIDEQDNCTLVKRAFLIVNDESEVELDLTREDNQEMVSCAVGRDCYHPVFEQVGVVA